jgi:putative sigma-54 modulation protein
MKIPLQIIFRNLSHSDVVETKIRKKVDKLSSFYEGITNCRVIVESSNRQGNDRQIRINLTVPGEELIVKRCLYTHTEPKTINMIFRDAFDAARRQLQEHIHRRRGEVKRSAEFRPEGLFS